MAYFLRSMAVIGVIALNSPVHRTAEPAGEPTAHRPTAARSTGPIDLKGLTSSAMAAREAAQVLAGLDPQTRNRLIEMMAASATGSLARTAEPATPR